MKKLLITSLSITLLGLLSCETDTKIIDPGLDMGKLYISKIKPGPGDKLYFQYTSPPKKDIKPRAIVDVRTGEASYPVDVELKDSSGVWIGEIKIPDSAQVIAFNFINDQFQDNNDNKGYIVPLYNESGEMVQGSKSSMGIYYIGYGASLYGIRKDKDSAMNLIAEDLKEYPSLKQKFDKNYPRVLMQYDKDEAISYIKERITFYEQKENLSSDNYEALAILYNLNDQKIKRDSIKELGIRKFPTSRLAQLEFVREFQRTEALDKKIFLYEEFQDKFGMRNNFSDYMARSIASDFGKKKQYEQLRKYASLIENKSSAATVFNSTAWELAEKGQSLKEAEEMSERSIQLIMDLQNHSDKPDLYSRSQYKERLVQDLNHYRDTYAFVHYKLGNVEKALEIQEKTISEESDPELNTRYVKYLIKNKQFKKAMEEAEQFIGSNRATAELETLHKEAFIKTTGGIGGLAGKLESIKTKAREKIKVELAALRSVSKAPNFKLRNLEGNKVDLNNLRGKTVVLDFWATWCGPCKASFPGMRTAVESFEENSNVKFFFINTMENSATREADVAEFIKKNDYPFQVLFDEVSDQESNSFKVAKAYGVQGIPTKVIIGPDGNIHFNIVGYHGKDKKMIEEIGLMIELTQKETVQSF